MSLTVCLLTRNEEKNLPRALGSVAGIADEVVLVDTGSTDQTVPIAVARGAKVYTITWDDDFAAGCNLALEKAKGDWIFWLNPDEELLPSQDQTVRTCLAQGQVLGYFVMVQDVPRADRLDFFSVTEQPRLFRRHPELRYVGRLQPAFVLPLAELARREGKQLYRTEITLRRHAYLSVLDEGKLHWTLRLLERELRDRPGQLHYLIQYGLALFRLNDPKGPAVLAEAADQLLPLRDAPTPPLPGAALLLEYVLNTPAAQVQGRLSRQDALELAQRWFPRSPPLVWALAHDCFGEQDFRSAATHLEKLVEFGRTGDYDRSAAFDPGILGNVTLMNLGSCYTRLGELDQAEHCFRQLLQNPALQAQAAQNLTLVEQLRQSR
jgi:tetratricopeptide (TPR) repeat protein